MYQSFPLNKICRYAEFFLCVGLAAVRLTHRFKAATPRRTTQLNEEKLCQLLANQTRAREKALQQTVTARPQLVAAAQVQHQTSSHVKMGIAATAGIQVSRAKLVLVAQTFALQVQTHLVSHVQKAHSSKSAPPKLTAILRSAPTVTAMVQLVQSALRTATAIHALLTVTAMTALLAKTAVDTRVVQSALHTATAMTAEHAAETVRLMAAQVLQPVAATAAR
jgi:hypothetical protein